MSTNLSRRHFISGLAAGGTAVALAGGAAHAAEPVVTPIYPLVEPRPSGGPIKLLCTVDLSPSEEHQIRSAGKNLDLILVKDKTELRRRIPEAEAVFGSVDGEMLAEARNLKWVQHTAAGVENLPKRLMEHPCVLTNMQRVYAPVIAETALALTLSLTRGLVQDSVPSFRARKWERQSSVPLIDLYQKSMGIVGLGGIGTETARRAHYGFGMKILAVDPKPLPKPEFVAELREPAWLHEMVPQVDVLVSCAPHTRETVKMFNGAVFSRMKPSAYFINVSRGGLVDQEALVRALKEKQIAGAGLDVTTPEPLPPEHALWDCPNLVITPHNSGAAPIRQVRMMALITENVRRYANGLPLLNVVDKARGY
ncbi:MAG: D-2-hydroxyacid dehydrogenase [Acidobacteriota bacterium]